MLSIPRQCFFSMFILAVLAAPNRVLPQDSSQVGQWGAVLQWPLQTIHMILLHNGKVFCSENVGYILYNPVDNTLTSHSAPMDLFCAGHVALADGRVLFQNGGSGGSISTYIYDPIVGPSGQWTSATEPSTPLSYYPTCTILGDGRVLALADNIVPAHLSRPRSSTQPRPLAVGGRCSRERDIFLR